MNLESYTNAHRSLALVDASTLTGRVKAAGPDAIDLLHRMSTNDLTPLIGHPGNGAQTVLTTEKGRIVDLLNVLSTPDGAILVTSKDHEDIVVNWLDKFVIMEDAKFTSATASISHFILFGPSAFGFLSALTATNVLELQNFASIEVTLASIPVRVQRSHRIIESGFSLFCDAEHHDALLSTLSSEIVTAGGAVLDADTYETIRIEAGIPTAPNELNEKHNPLETTLVQAISWTKGCYIGQEVIARLDTYDKVQRHLMGIQFASPVESNVPFPLLSADGTEIGEVTSLTSSPALGTSIALAFVKTPYANPNAAVAAAGVNGTIRKLPFDIEF
jgi:tRNA-modifying protein YgfZ